MEPDEPEFDGDNTADQKLLTDVCAGLVIGDQESRVMRLVDYTAQEYFEQSASRWFPDANEQILRTCLTYLSYDHALREGSRSNSTSFNPESNVEEEREQDLEDSEETEETEEAEEAEETAEKEEAFAIRLFINMEQVSISRTIEAGLRSE